MLHIPVRSASTIFATLTLHLKNILDFSGTVTQVNLVHCELERSHDIFGFRVKVVCNRNVADLILREELLCIVAGFSHVTAQSGKILGDNHIGLTGLQGSHHFLETRTLKVAARPTIINEVFQNCDTVLLAVGFHNFFLIRDTGGFTLLSFFTGQTVISVGIQLDSTKTIIAVFGEGGHSTSCSGIRLDISLHGSSSNQRLFRCHYKMQAPSLSKVRVGNCLPQLSSGSTQTHFYFQQKPD